MEGEPVGEALGEVDVEGGDAGEEGVDGALEGERHARERLAQVHQDDRVVHELLLRRGQRQQQRHEHLDEDGRAVELELLGEGDEEARAVLVRGGESVDQHERRLLDQCALRHRQLLRVLCGPPHTAAATAGRSGR